MKRKQSDNGKIIAQEWGGLVPVSELLPHPANPNQSDVGAIYTGIGAVKFYGAVIAQKSTGYILAGHGRVQAAIEHKMPAVPVIWVDCDPETARKILVGDNQIASLASWDDQGLADLLQSIQADTGTLEGTGFDQEALDNLLADLAQPGYGQPVEGEDDVPEASVESVTCLGDLWLCGRHRVLCGDCTDADVLAICINGKSLAIVITSPPYNQGLDNFSPSGMHKESDWVPKVARLAYSDTMPEVEYQNGQSRFLKALWAVMPEGASLFYNHKNRYREKEVLSPLQWLPGPFKLRQEIIWSRPGSVTQNARMFLPSDERVYWMYKGQDFRFNDATEIKSWCTVWQINPETNKDHAAAFPVELPRRCLLACSEEGDAVLDPYLGSGTTLIAAETTERICYGIEIEPRSMDVTVRRWQDFTRQQATLDGDGRTFDEIAAERRQKAAA